MSRPNRHRFEVNEFQPHVKETLQRLLPEYDVIDFSSNITWVESLSVQHQPDLAIISKNRRHWTIVEVELHTHEVGYSYSSELSSPHIYRQVETFAEGDYNIKHIKKIAEILNEEVTNFSFLLSKIPEVLVIGDNSDVLYGDEHNNWNRLLEIGDHVHLAFLEQFEDLQNPSESCSYYEGWLPPPEHIFNQKLKQADGAWVDSLTAFKGEMIDCPDGEIMIEIDGINTLWNHKKNWKILQSLDTKSTTYLKKNSKQGIFLLSHSPRGYSLEASK